MTKKAKDDTGAATPVVDTNAETAGTPTETPAANNSEDSHGVESVAGLADDIVSDAPEPSEHAIAQEQDRQQRQATAQDQANAAGLKDRYGRTFDPTIHEVDSTGAPLVNDRNKLRCKRGRRGNTDASGSTVSQPKRAAQISNNMQQADQAAQAAINGKAAAGMTVTLGLIIGGEEWLPRVDKANGLDEKAMLEGAYAEYFRATGMKDIPPGWALSFALVAYAAPRFAMPQTRTRFGRFKEGVSLWWRNRKLKREGINRGAQSHTRHDGERKDNASEATRGGV